MKRNILYLVGVCAVVTTLLVYNATLVRDSEWSPDGLKLADGDSHSTTSEAKIENINSEQKEEHNQTSTRPWVRQPMNKDGGSGEDEAQKSSKGKSNDHRISRIGIPDRAALRKMREERGHHQNSNNITDTALKYLKLQLLEDISGLGYQTIVKKFINGEPVTEKPLSPALKIAVVTTWRSGSTFLEALLSSHGAMYEVYEPLLFHEIHRIREGPEAVKTQKLIKDLLSCKYNSEQYMAALRVPQYNMVERNAHLQKVFCAVHPQGRELCTDPEFLREACLLYPWQLMKTVRLKLSLMKPLMEDSSLADLRIIYLVRDPRAVINSRTSTVGWCKPHMLDCSSPAVLCQDQLEDLQTAYEFQKLYPGRIYILRYEDMANEPYETAKKLFSTLGLKFHEKIVSFIREHTTVEFDKPWTISRDTKKRLMYWTKKMKISDVKTVEEACTDSMRYNGYKPVDILQNLTLNDVLGPMSRDL